MTASPPGPRYLHVTPRAGLANRLRALASGMWMARETDRHLVMTWVPNEHLGCGFGGLFTNQLDEDAKKLDGLVTAKYLKVAHIPLDEPGDPPVIHVEANSPFSHRPDLPPFSSGHWRALRSHLLTLTPVPDVQTMVRQAADRMSSNTLGLHLRRHGKHSHQVPRSLFVAEIDRLLTGEGFDSIFMATDEADALAEFRKRYGDRVWSLDAILGRTISREREDLTGVRAALADLLALSRTRKIVGTFYSSFTELAGILGATPFKRLGGQARMAGADRHYSTHLDEN